MNDSFLLELPSILQEDIIFLSLQVANNILRDVGEQSGRAVGSCQLLGGGTVCQQEHLNWVSLCKTGNASVR